MNLQDYLPAELQGPATAITRIAVGLSGAGVYRIEADGRSFVLKLATDSESAADWRSTLNVQRLAADAGLAPRIVYVDESRRAVLTEFVIDRSFRGFYWDPRTRKAALTLLGRTVRRLHALPVPAESHQRDPRDFLREVWEGLLAGFPVPAFARDSVQRVLGVEPAHSDRALVLGHNDLNPTNFVYDSEAILLLDWATAGPMEPYYDLAVLALFLRMDAATAAGLLSAYDDRQCVELPSRFLYDRRLAATLTGSLQLYLARQLKHAGATGAESLDSVLSLGEFYQQLGAGALQLGTADGQWAFGLALLKQGLAL